MIKFSSCSHSYNEGGGYKQLIVFYENAFLHFRENQIFFIYIYAKYTDWSQSPYRIFIIST